MPPIRDLITPLGGILLAFVAGSVDTATFLQVYELFSAHITGNFVVFAIALVHGVRGVDWLKLIALPVFFMGVPLAAFVYDRSRHKIRVVFALEALLLAAAGGLELLLQTHAYDGWLAMLLVLAMAVQNAAHQVEPGLGATSAVMTTNAAKLFVALWRRFSPPPPGEATVKANGIAARMACFALGCIVSAFATHDFGLASVLLPAGIVVLVAAFYRR
ncbi:YoaK family protein [uncultured Methylovirgula sp.]|uniref:YoaK family protein n=1 Tax=uncultured Methylovirgula sp. TaxID=1285960 RepID=UPI0026212D9C|nr:YoaK family protein [uncultured Methylovirgula sp.]